MLTFVWPLVGKVFLTINVLVTLASALAVLLPRRPVFLMRTWAHSWVEPRRWSIALRGWLSWWARCARGRRHRRPEPLDEDMIAQHDVSNPCEELYELAARVGRTAAYMGANPENWEFDAADLVTLRAAAIHLDAAALALRAMRRPGLPKPEGDLP